MVKMISLLQTYCKTGCTEVPFKWLEYSVCEKILQGGPVLSFIIALLWVLYCPLHRLLVEKTPSFALTLTTFTCDIYYMHALKVETQSLIFTFYVICMFSLCLSVFTPTVQTYVFKSDSKLPLCVRVNGV